MTDSKTRSNKMNETCSRFSGIQVRQSDCCTICSFIVTWYGQPFVWHRPAKRSVLERKFQKCKTELFLTLEKRRTCQKRKTRNKRNVNFLYTWLHFGATSRQASEQHREEVKVYQILLFQSCRCFAVTPRALKSSFNTKEKLYNVLSPENVPTPTHSFWSMEQEQQFPEQTKEWTLWRMINTCTTPKSGPKIASNFGAKIPRIQ